MPLGLFCFFFGGHLPQTSGFRSAKQIIMSTQVRARIWSDRNIFCTLGEGQQWQGLMPLGLSLVFLVVTCPGLPSAKQIRAASFRSTLAMSPVV